MSRYDKSWRACAGCGGASTDVEDVSLLVGSGAEVPRHLAWEHPLCKLCREMLLSRNMSKYCPIGCREIHVQTPTKDEAAAKDEINEEIISLQEAVNKLAAQLNLDEETFEAVFYGVLGFHLGARDPSLEEERKLHDFFKRWRWASDLS